MLRFFLVLSVAAASDELDALKQDSECTSAECTLNALQFLGIQREDLLSHVPERWVELNLAVWRSCCFCR